MPANYVNTYTTYKEGTKRITTWLAKTAAKCGADLALPAPRAGSASVEYELPLSCFVSLAKAIRSSTDPSIKLPRSIATLLRNVIDLRKQANAFFSKHRKFNAVSNLGHTHFISVLEEVLSILQPSPSSDDQTTPSHTIPTNLFEALTIEEPSVSEDVETKTASQNASQDVQYDIETSDSECVFALFTFFNDMNEIREYLQSVWKDYLSGKLDIMSAAVTTDTAFTLLQHSWDELVDADLGVDDYSTAVALMLQSLDEKDNDIRDFMQWVCYDTANLLDEYVKVLQVNPVPIPIPGALGTYNPSQNREKLSIDEKHHEDRIVLMELLPEFSLIFKARMEIPTRDLLTAGLKRMIDARSSDALPPYALFATKILLDIHHILRAKVDQPFQELQSTGRRVVRTIDHYLRHSRGKTNGSWNAEHNEMLRNVRDFAKQWALTDMLATIARGARGMKPRPFHLLKNHPILSGLLIFRLNTLMNDVGIVLCNSWGSVIYPAHLYNAAQHSVGLEAAWMDMDYILSVHTPQRIFVGAAPTDATQYWKRCLSSLGGSAVNFAKNRRRDGPEGIVESRNWPQGLKTTSPIKDVFRDRYVSDGFAALSTPNIVAMTAVAAKAERIRPSSVNMAAFCHRILLQKQYTILQLLRAVREGMASEEMHLLFNYFALNQRGNSLMEDFRKALHDKMLKYFGSEYLEGDHQLPYVIAYIFQAMADADSDVGIEMLRDASAELQRFLDRGEGDKGVVAARKLANAS